MERARSRGKESTIEREREREGQGGAGWRATRSSAGEIAVSSAFSVAYPGLRVPISWV